MRPGQNKRSRGRNGGGMPHHGGGGGRGPGPRPPHRSQTFDSNGPSVKIRGNAYQVFERYIAMAREAQTSGDRIAAENLYQHAEHYYRIMNAAGEGQGHGQPRPNTPADNEMGGGDGQGQPRDEAEAQPQVQVQSTQPQPAPPPDDEQPPYRDEPPRSY
ncbi:MAG TPA: DUF4167 domain-containing protein [Stellaceae bacterium]|nr:DUF4167 domain-containing protein [Stellaceae bacterium]